MEANKLFNWRNPVCNQKASFVPDSSLHDIQVVACRRLAILLGTVALVVFAIQAPPMPGRQGWPVLLVTVGWIFVCTLVVQLAPHRLRIAQWLLGAGAAMFLVLLVAATGDPMVGVLNAGLPVLAVMLAGWPVALAAVALTALLPTLATTMFAVPSLPATLVLLIVGGGALLAAIVALSYNGVNELAASALRELERAQQAVDDARSQRAELIQIEEDLLQATREQTRLLERLKASNQVAEEARQTKQEFIAMVSHELRTPLNMVIAYSELITQSPHLYRGRLPAALLADMTVILRNAQHLSKLVDDILDLSQIEAERMALSKAWNDIGAVAAEAAEAVRPLFVTKRLTLAVEIAEDLPRVYCDQTRIRQVMINLLSNGGRFTEQGGVCLQVWQEDDLLRICVRDTGPGIRPEDQVHLFEPFQQLDASIRRKHGGSGLGLNITKHFVEMHDGKIWIESAVGVGSTFQITLPLGIGGPPVVMTPASRRWVNPYDAYVPRTRPRIAPVPRVAPRYVVMDYGRTLERLLSRYLENAEIVRVESQVEALRVLGESPAQALVVNSAMLSPAGWIEDGWARLPFDTPLIACWLPDDEGGEQLGGIHRLVKPVNMADLRQAVSSVGPDAETVLVVDDDPDIQRLFTRMLTAGDRPYRVLTASSGQEALTLLNAAHPDVVLLDLLMPQMTGFEVLQAKQRDVRVRDIPVIVVSSLDPHSQPIISNQLFVARDSGLSSRDLLACIQAISAVLAPAAPSKTPALSVTPDA